MTTTVSPSTTASTGPRPAEPAGDDLLRELEPAAATALDRHLAIAQEWMPHDYVPWGEGRPFGGPDGEPWSPEQSRLDTTLQTALEVNLLTEDNLPSYHREIAQSLGRDSAWGTWVHRWTAEEGRHALVMRDWLLVTRGVDPDALERGRMAVMEAGYDGSVDGAPRDPMRLLAYVSFQELATRVSHRNTGRATGDPVAEKLLQRVATDENLHMIFYRGLVAEGLRVAPSTTVVAIADELLDFAMPGTVIPEFWAKARLIAERGIYDLRIHHDDVLQPLLRHWGFFELEGLSPEAEEARRKVAEFLPNLDAMATRMEDKRAARQERQAAQV